MKDASPLDRGEAIFAAMRSTLLAWLLPAVVACAAPPPAAPPAPPPFDRDAAEREVARALDDLHDAAARSDLARYFAHYTPGAIFLGTDATERWGLAALHAYADPRFAQGKGWVYHLVRRAVSFSAGGDVAWFDEDLRGEKAGPTRGSGVLVHERGRWLVAHYNLALTVPNEHFTAVRALIDAPPAPPDVRARYQQAYRDAMAAAAAGDLAKAGALLAALVPEAKTRPADDLEFWLHNALTWVSWAAGDLPGALAEVDRSKTALDHGLLPDDRLRSLRLHELWDRAYLMLDEAMGAAREKKARMAAAEAARADYDARAKAANDRDGMAVLAAYFAVRKHDARTAAAEARRVDAEKDTDLQDLYVVAMALEAAGDHDEAQRVRARICGGKEYLMKPLIVRALAAEGHACPRR
jgi:ketosteroid isomerase-like protein